VTTSDGQEFTVLRSVLERKSKTLKDLFAEVKDTSKDVVPLGGDLSGETFQSVVAWINQHKDDKDPEPILESDDAAAIAGKTEPATVVVCDWDKEFFAKLEQAQLFKLLHAANYLDIRPLLDVACRTMAEMVIGKTPKQIYELFGVAQELTPEEEEEVKKENPWLADN
jgi:S-phase kinase-associated protein 1